MASKGTSSRKARIDAKPNPVPPGEGSGKTTISWSTGSGSRGWVYVSGPTGEEKLFARGANGSQDARWITTAVTHTFVLYGDQERSQPLASVRVAMDQSPIVQRAATPSHSEGRRIVSPDFRPLASHLLVDPLPPSANFVLVEDSDVGPILTHPLDKEIGGWLREKRTWAPGEGQFLRNRLQPGMNVIDIGANIGYFTLLCAREIGPTGRVLAVEAEPEFCLQLRANIALNDLENVELLPLAAHRQTGIMGIWRNPDNFSGSFVRPVDPDSSSTSMQAVRLDDALNPDTPIDVIKIDIEGMDHAAVQGLQATIRRWCPTILVEYHPLAIELFGEDPVAVLGYYRSLGLQVSVLGTDALRLRDYAGMELDELMNRNLVITADLDVRIAELTHPIGLINLVLTPLGRPSTAHLE